MYIDPGLGGLIIQGVVAAIAALSVIGIGFRNKIAAFFKRKPKDTSDEGGNNEATSDDAFFDVVDEKDGKLTSVSETDGISGATEALDE